MDYTRLKNWLVVKIRFEEARKNKMLPKLRKLHELVEVLEEKAELPSDVEYKFWIIDLYPNK